MSMAANELTPTRSAFTLEEKKAFRQTQFKKKGTPYWKETYRERCASRLKRNRHVLFDKKRMESSSPSQEMVTESVYSIMQEEWEQLRSEFDLPKLEIGRKRAAMSPMIGTNPTKRQITGGFVTSDSHQTEDEDIDDVLSLMDEITKELIQEEQSVLSQYEDTLKFSEAALSSAIECIGDDPVVCPVCLKCVLVQERQFIYCRCGLSIDTEQDGVTLEYVRKQLSVGTTAHSQVCDAVPVFAMDGILGLQNLVMKCSICDFMHIVL